MKVFVNCNTDTGKPLFLNIMFGVKKQGVKLVSALYEGSEQY